MRVVTYIQPVKTIIIYMFLYICEVYRKQKKNKFNDFFKKILSFLYYYYYYLLYII